MPDANYRLDRRVLEGELNFAVTIVSPWNYAHSEAFREVAIAVRSGLAALGHDALISTRFVPDRQNIILGPQLLPLVGQVPPRNAILFNLEQVSEGSPWITPHLLHGFRRYQVWDYSEANADAWSKFEVPRPVVVPIGYAPELSKITPSEEDIDVLFYGSINDRRANVLNTLSARGVKVKAVFGIYGDARDALIARSKIVLNAHFYPAKVFEIVRVSYLLANRKCVVSERGCRSEEESPFEQGVAFSDYDGLVETCIALLHDADRRKQIAAAGFAAISSRPQSEFLRPAIDLLTPKENAA